MWLEFNSYQLIGRVKDVIDYYDKGGVLDYMNQGCKICQVEFWIELIVLFFDLLGEGEQIVYYGVRRCYCIIIYIVLY